jgi:hypothetical protein
MRDARDLGGRLHHARLAVGVDDRDQRGIRAGRGPDFLDPHAASGVDTRATHTPSVFFEPRTRLLRARMLDGRSDDVAPVAASLRDSADREVAGLRPS